MTEAEIATEKSTNYRDVTKIALQILKEIPKKEEQFIISIYNFINKMNYMAPEILSSPECWIPFTTILQTYITDEKIEWQKKIIDIYMGYEV